MERKTLKSESFAAIFSKLTPDQVVRKCKALAGSDDICSDVNNWKAYVAKRFSRKRALQRPDLLTSQEWIAYAISLEDKSYGFTFYNVGLNEHDLEGHLYEGYTNQVYNYFEWTISISGIPFIRREDYHPAIFICDFQILGIDDLLDVIGEGLSVTYMDINYLESSQLAVERHVEILTDLLPKAIALRGPPIQIVTSLVSGNPSRRTSSMHQFVSLEATIALLKSMSSVHNGSMNIDFSDSGEHQFYINWWPVRL